jgi:ribosome-associated heat shock protein Hsp15
MIVTNKVRLDKWLWAARFFKTRAKAKEAIDGGKVHIDGVRGKAAKEVQIGVEIRLRQGWDEKTVIVKSLSEQRRNATIAETLYEETLESTEQRTMLAAQRKSAGQQSDTKERPTKRNRRLIHQFRDKNLNAE